MDRPGGGVLRIGIERETDGTGHVSVSLAFRDERNGKCVTLRLGTLRGARGFMTLLAGAVLAPFRTNDAEIAIRGEIT